jgi:hypothetical protein
VRHRITGREQIDIAVLERGELLFPQQCDDVVAGARAHLTGAVYDVHERVEFLLEAGQERQDADTIAEKEKRQAVACFPGNELLAEALERKLVD